MFKKLFVYLSKTQIVNLKQTISTNLSFIIFFIFNRKKTKRSNSLSRNQIFQNCKKIVRSHFYIEFVVTQSKLQINLTFRYNIKFVVISTKINFNKMNVYNMHTTKAMICEKFLNIAIEIIRIEQNQKFK